MEKIRPIGSNQTSFGKPSTAQKVAKRATGNDKEPIHTTQAGLCQINISDWWFGTFGLFSISYMGCHPSH